MNNIIMNKNQYTGEFFGISLLDCKFITGYTWNITQRNQNKDRSNTWRGVKRNYNE